MATQIFDLHAHFSFKPANSANYESGVEPDNDHWRERIRKKGEFSELITLFEKSVIKTSQAHGNACTEGRHRVVINGLYPLERGFIREAFITEVATLSGFSKKTLRKINSFQISYMERLENEYNNLLNHQDKQGSTKDDRRYFVCGQYSEVIAKLNADENFICIINSIEGAHSFGDMVKNSQGFPVGLPEEKKHIKAYADDKRTGDPLFRQLINSISKNIDEAKRRWTKHPFFVGISHHYANHLAGHSESLAHIVDFLVNQDAATLDLVDPRLPLRYYGVGLYPWGLKIVIQLLARQLKDGTASRRYLIDVKHMSPQARVDYYQFLATLQANNPNDRIPIIKSHTAIAGISRLADALADPTGVKGNIKYFYPKSINLFDDEIQTIVDSDGLIGLMIDENRIMGRKIPPESGFTKPRNSDFKNKGPFNKIAKKTKSALNQIQKRKHKIQWCLDELKQQPVNPGEIQKKIKRHQQVIKECKAVLRQNLPKIKKTYLSILFRQIFHIIELTGEKGWNHISLGSDYDGVINPVDIYPTASEMTSFKSDLIDFWSANLNHTDAKISALYNKYLFGRTPAFWINKFIILNGMNFLKKYFTEKYLEQGIKPRKGWILTEKEMSSFAPPMV